MVGLLACCALVEQSCGKHRISCLEDQRLARLSKWQKALIMSSQAFHARDEQHLGSTG